MLTKMATAAGLGSLSDIIAQLLEGQASFVVPRFFALAFVNTFYITPLLSVFYAVNEWVAGDVLRLPAETWRGACVRLAVDQLLFAPACILGFFWVYGLAEARIASPLGGGGAHVYAAIATKLRVEYRAMLISNWQVWILPQLINFRLMPPALRLPFGSLVALVWGVIQSLIANR